MQSKKLLSSLVLGLSATFLTSSAFAFLSSPFGWYLEANFGSSRLSNVTYPGDTNNSGIGGNVNFGYKFMPFFALEVGYTRYANSTITDDITNTKAANIKYYSYDLAMRGIVPIACSGFELFAKLGVGRNNAHIDISNEEAAADLGVSSGQKSSTGIYMGIGGQYYFMPEMAGIIQWQRQEGGSSVGTQDLYSIGVSYIFD